MDRHLDSQNTDSRSKRRKDEADADELRDDELIAEAEEVKSADGETTDGETIDEDFDDEEIAEQVPPRPHLISVDMLRAAGALDVPASWRKSLGPTKIERDLFSDLVDD